MPKGKRKNVVDEKDGILLNIFSNNAGLLNICDILDISEEKFLQLHAFVYMTMINIAQIRSRAMSSGIKDPQEIQKLESVNFFTKVLSKGDEASQLGVIYAVDKSLAYLSSTDKDYVKFKAENIFAPGKSNTKQAQRLIRQSEENIQAFVKGSYFSFIGQITQIPIYKPASLGRYSDCTIGMLPNMVRGGNTINWTEISDSVKQWNDKEFGDYINLNSKDNLTPMEASWKTNLIRLKGDSIKTPKLNAKESGLSEIEKIRRNRINNERKNN